MGTPVERPVTVREVAAAASVSQATVSRVLSGSAVVSTVLAQRVLAAAAALGYAPNLSARSLASGRTATVGVVVPNLANPYFYALIKRMIHDAEADGYRLLIADSDEKIMAETALSDGLLRQSDGLILCSPRGPESDLNRLRALGKPIVVFGRDGTAPEVSRVIVAGPAAIRDLVDHLAGLGHRDLLYLRGPRHSWQDQQRFRAYRAAAAGRLTVRALACGGSMEDGLRVAARVLDTGVSVVVSYNDLVAFGVVAGLADLGVSVPRDVSVTGYDDIPFARFLTPALTTIASPQEEAGAATWRAMSGLLRGETAGTRVTLSCRVVIRDSTAAPAGPAATGPAATAGPAATRPGRAGRAGGALMRPVLVDADRAAAAIPDGATVAISGSGGGILECGAVLAAIERRYLAGAGPTGLTLVHAFGIGDAADRGLSTLAHPGLVRRVIGGHWTWSPRMGELAASGQIEAYALPAGVISQLLREIGARRPGLFTRIGLDTFVDPRQGGGAMNGGAAGAPPLVELTTVDGREHLRYRPFPVDVALVRGSVVDPLGNLSCRDEPAELDVLAAAQAARASGGVVIAQVKRCLDRPLDPRSVTLPAPLLDLVVVAPDQWQTYRAEFDPALSGTAPAGGAPAAGWPSTVDWSDPAAAIIARRAALEVPDGAVLNVGFGIAASVVDALAEQGRSDRITTAIEQGLFGGRPETGALFGVAYGSSARLASTTQFDLFDGGLLDVCCLGMAEVDATGAVNVSRIGDRLVGPGGFIEISQSARRAVFCGTFTTRGLSVEATAGRLTIRREGAIDKFVAALDHRTFSGRLAVREGREVLYVTERAVFRLTPRGLALVELAPGVSVEDDILPHMGFRPIIEEVAPMPAQAFVGGRVLVQLEGDPV